MDFYMLAGEVYKEDPANGYSEGRPRNARRITAAQARDHLNRVTAENDAAFEARQERLERDRAKAAAEAAERRQVLADWLAESGAPPEVQAAVLE